MSRSGLLSACLLALTLVPAAHAAETPDCGPLLPIVQAAYSQVAPLPTTEEHPDNDRFRVQGGRVLDITATPGDAFNAHVVTCKPWPARDDLLLVAVPLIDPATETQDGHQADLEVLVVNAATREPMQRLRLRDAATDDAMMLRAIVFDTARYNLAPDNRAFGVRVTRENNSRANPAAETTLYLLDRPQGDAGPLRLVLNDLVVEGSGGEWDTNCAGEFHTSSATLSLAPTATRGMQDIVLRNTSETRVNIVKGDDCLEHVKEKGVSRETLRFDGKQYPVPLTQHRVAG